MDGSSIGIATNGKASRGRWVGVIVTLAAIALIVGSGQAPHAADPALPGWPSASPRFAKVGKRYLNLQHVTSVEEYPGRNGLKVYFVGDRGNFLYFGDADADALRRLLDSVSMTPPSEAGHPGGPAPADNPR
jgi:hypothetical protein